MSAAAVRTAMVLAAGRGVRMMPLTGTRAKPTLPVLGVSMLARILRGLAAQGVTTFGVNAHHAPDSVAAVIERELPEGTRAQLFVEPGLMGSAGAFVAPRALLAAGEFFAVHNADTLLEVPLARLAARAAAVGAGERRIGTVLVRPGRTRGYGGLMIEPAADGLVVRTRFAPGEEPSGPGEPATFLGVAVVSRAVLDHVPSDRPSELFPDVVLPLLREGWTLAAEVHAGAWIEFTSPHHYLDNVTRLVLSNREHGFAELPGGTAPVEHRPGGAVFRARGATLDPGASVEGAVALEPGARVADRGLLRNAALLDGAIVETGASLSNVVVGPGAIVPAGASLADGTYVRTAEGGHDFRPFAD